MEGSSSSLRVESSFFVDNRQHELLGASISQSLCDPSSVKAVNNAVWQSPETLAATTGCEPMQMVSRWSDIYCDMTMMLT